MIGADRAGAIRELAALGRCGLPPRAALVVWPTRCPGRPAIERCARLAALGAPLAVAVDACRESLGRDATALLQALHVHRALGGNLAATIEALAATIERRELQTRSASAHVAGARLSARLVALLPVVFVPLMPGTLRFDLIGVSMLGVGISLIALGLRWIARLIPEPNANDSLGPLVAALICEPLRAGVPLPQVLKVLTKAPQAPSALGRAVRRADLGVPWSRALSEAEDPGLESLGRTIRQAESLGVPVADAIAGTFDFRNSSAERTFEERLRRAPVRMALPLTVCVLPAYILLGLGPFLRGLAT